MGAILGGMLMRTFALVVLFAFVTPICAGEKLSGGNIDVRTYLSFKAPEAAVQKFVPDGWEISPPPTGPAKGSNVTVVLIESVSASDADGKSISPFRGGVLTIPVKKRGTDATVSMVVFGIAAPEAVPGAYGVYVPGKSTIERKVRAGSDGKSTADETWEFKAEDKNAIKAQIRYSRGVTVKMKVEAKVYSGAKPEFFRIYRVDQVVDIARSTATGVDRVTKVSFKASGPKLAPLFNGSEQLISVTSIPSYSRSIFLPD